MQKKFITNLAFLLLLNLLIKPFWLLGIDRTVQNLTGAEVYGSYYALLNFSFLFNIILDLGITNFNNRNISQNRQLLQKHLSGIVSLRIILAALYLLVSLAAALIIGYDAVQIKMALILLFNQALLSFILYLRSNLAGLHLFKTDSIVSVLDRMIMIMICAFLIWGRSSNEPFKIEWFIWSQSVAYVITILFIAIFLGRKVKMTKLNWNPVFALMILKKSYPFAILILLMTFYNRIDSVMIERMLPDGNKQAGIYAQAYRLMDAANMLAYLFAALLLPMFSHMIKRNEPITDLLKLSYSLLAVPAIIVAVISFSFRNEIMDLLYHEHVANSSTIFAMLMISFVAICTTYIYGTLLTANGNLKHLNIMAGIGMGLNIILNLILIPHYMATGAAVSSLITQFVTAAIQIGLCMRIFKIQVNLPLIVKYLLLITGVVAAAILIHSLRMNWIFQVVLVFLSGLGISVIIKIIDIKEIKQTLSKEGL